MLPLSIAWRFLMASKTQTILIALGIAVGVSVQIFIGGIITGLREDLVETTIGNSSHVTVLARERNDLLADDNQVYQQLMGFDGNIRVVNRVLEFPGNVTNDQSDAIIVRGFDFDDANQVYQFDERLVEGRLPNAENEIMLGINLVNDLNLSLNDTVNVLFTFEIPPITEEFTLVGVFDFRVSQINQTWLITTLDTAQSVYAVDQLSAYEMQLNDVFLADQVAERLREELSDNFRVIEWKSSNQELLSGLEGQNISGIMIQVFVIISVVLGISSVLAITVVQKSKQLGILKAMGIQDGQAQRIFLYQGALLGFIGGVLGILLGIGLSESFSAFALNPDGTPILELVITPGFIALSASLAVTAALIASVIPARGSAKLSVIEVIRNG